MLVKSKIYSKREAKFIGKDLVVIETDKGREVCLRKNNLRVYKKIPCKGCATGCYNFQIGDCKDYKWSKFN